jgi:hypothetical protein
MSAVCPITKTEKEVEGIAIDTILEITKTKHNVWAENSDAIFRIFGELRSGVYGGLFKKSSEDTAWNPPFSIILSSTNQKTGGKIIAMGTGVSIADGYINSRVPRFEGDRSKLLTDPPPRENLDLFLNILYALCDREDLIAAGPAEARLIEPINNKAKNTIWVLSYVWPFLVVIFGGIVMLVRRK